MFSTGLANPDSVIAGNMKVKTPRNACCWVCARDEMKAAAEGEFQRDLQVLAGVHGSSYAKLL